MAYEIPGFSFSLDAGADLRERQFRFCDIDTDGEAVVATAAGRIVGVINNKPNVGEATTVFGSGVSMVRAAGAITKGAVVEVGADGQATPHAAGIRVGIALKAAAAAGSLIPVLLFPNLA